MPIYQVEERSFAAIKCIGRLRKGDPKPERGPGKDLDRFRFTSDDPAVMAAFMAAYGNGTEYASELHVYLPYVRLQANWDYWFETWGGKRLKYRCNGREWVKWLLPDGSGYSREPKPCPICARRETARQGEHTPTGRLVVLLPELLKAGYPGTVLLVTRAWSDIYSLNSCFLAVEEQRTYGRPQDYRGIEFILRRELRDIPTREHGVQKKHVVVLETVSEWIEAQIRQARTDTLASVAQLVDPSTGEILDDEFPPDDDPGAGLDDHHGELDDLVPDTSWKNDPDKRRKIQEECDILRITREDLRPALGVDRLGEYQGSFESLLQKLTDYAMYNKLQAAGPVPDDEDDEEEAA